MEFTGSTVEAYMRVNLKQEKFTVIINKNLVNINGQLSDIREKIMGYGLKLIKRVKKRNAD